MALFLIFTAHLDTPQDPMEFFPSIEVALRSLQDRACLRKGLRARAAGVTAHTYRTWCRVREEAEWPELTDPDGWMAVVWWRKAEQLPPKPSDRPGEVWIPSGGKVDRTRLNSDEWNTGRVRRFLK